MSLPITATFGTLPVETKAASLPVSGIATPEPWLLEWGGFPVIAGGPITPAQALQVPTVLACVNLISSAIGSLPCRVFRDDADGGRTAAPDHPAWDVTFADANDWTDAGQLRAQLVTDALLYGNGYALVQRDDEGRPVAILRLQPQAVSILHSPITWEPVFQVSGLEGLETVAHADMIHVPAPASADGITGVSTIWHAREAIGLSLAMRRHFSRIMSKGARPSGILSFPTKIQPSAIANVRASFEAQHSGEGSGKPAVVHDGATYTQTESKTVDLQFAETRAFEVLEIAKAFNVPPTLIGELAHATLSNSEQMGQQFLTKTLAHWINTLKAAYRRALIAREDRKIYSVDFDLTGLVRADSAQRAAFYASLRACASITANEVRRWESLPARPDGDSLASPHVAPAAPPKDQDPSDV